MFLWSLISIFYKSDCSDVYSFDETFSAGFGFEKLSNLSEIIFSYFFPESLLVWLCPLPIFPKTRSFSSLQTSKYFPDLNFFLSFNRLFFFSYFILNMTCLQCQIPFLYPGCIFLLFVSGHLTRFNFLKIPLYHSCIWDDLSFLRFCKVVASHKFSKYRIKLHHSYKICQWWE